MSLSSEASASQPIGIFDSGIGGLTVAHAITSALPEEQIIYFGDTAHLPYGDKSADAIRFYSLKICKFLLDRQCKMIVVACNSASSSAYRDLLDFFHGQALFVNVVDPLVEAVAKASYRKVGIIATKATIQSGAYEKKLKQLRPDLEVASLATPLLAPMIEEGYVYNEISHSVIHNYLERPELEGIDALVLACTHYPLIRDEINAYYEGRVDIIDSTGPVAHEVRGLLEAHDLLRHEGEPEHHFYVSDFTPSFQETTALFYETAVRLEVYPMW